jgi:hypothetical protein
MFKSGTSTFLDKLNKYEELGRKSKDTIVIADSKELAEEIKQNMIDEAELAGHNDTGTMENSFSVRPAGGGDYAVKAVDYTKFVNGYDREANGTGFVDDAVNQALLDLGGEAEVII